MPTKEQAKVRNMLRLLREFGIALGMPHARHIEGKLWELRSGAIRLFYFVFADRRFAILHGYRKRSAKAPKKEIAIAL
jgi:phage-related protein